MKRQKVVSPRRSGFILLEVLVAMVILAIVLSSIAAMSFAVSKRSINASGSSYRNSVLLQEVNRLEALPFDSLLAGTTSVTESAMPYPHTRVVTITAPSTSTRQVKVVITPSNSLYRPDSVLFTRTLPATTNALSQ